MDELVAALRHQRHLLERLLFRLTTVRLLLASGDERFLPLACEEVHRVAEALRRAEGTRHSAFVTAAAEVGGGGGRATLAELARTSPEPYGFILRDHLTRLTELVEAIAAVAGDHRPVHTSNGRGPAAEHRAGELGSVEPDLLRAYVDVAVERATQEASDTAVDHLVHYLG